MSAAITTTDAASLARNAVQPGCGRNTPSRRSARYSSPAFTNAATDVASASPACAPRNPAQTHGTTNTTFSSMFVHRAMIPMRTGVSESWRA